MMCSTQENPSENYAGNGRLKLVSIIAVTLSSSKNFPETEQVGRAKTL